MPFHAYFDSPVNYQNKYAFYNVGASPLLLKKLIELLDFNKANIEEIKLGFYLFNNEILNNKLIELAKNGIKADVVTIPLEGYDASNAKDIINFETGETICNASKHDLAKKIFTAHYKKEVENYTLYFFPHIYLRSGNVKNFSRGNMPYSLHLKSFLIKYKDKTGTVGISSSNFAVRDLVKEENLLIITEEADYFNPTYNFFNALIKNSIPIYDFDFKKDYTGYEIEIETPENFEQTNFLAPFYFNSGFKAEDKLIELIDSANSTIKIAAQHICPVEYSIDGSFHSQYQNEKNKRNGLLNKIIEKANNGIKVEIISQTFASGNDTIDQNFRKPANAKSFIEFYKAIEIIPNISYYVNENIHSKYIIADDTVFVSSFNYTPTQFIYLDKVNISSFKNNPGKSYNGVYSETGQYCIIKDAALAQVYKTNFTALLARDETRRIK